MNGRYAIIGWGSLIWDLEILTPHVDLPWQMRAGPALPMEFSRISAKRKMALAVCLDLERGEPCPTHAVPSRRDDIGQVIEDLAARERAPFRRIGAVCLQTGHGQGRTAFAEIVAEWCREHGWQGAVWTDLTSNFDDLAQRKFSVSSGADYLRTLDGESLAEAVRYISHAPETTDTPLRRALDRDPWWQDQKHRLGLVDNSAGIR